MNTKQMNAEEELLGYLLEKHAECVELFGRLNAEDKAKFYPRFIASTNNIEKLIKDGRVKQLPAVAAK